MTEVLVGVGMDAESGSHSSGKRAEEHPGTVLVKLYPNAVVNGVQVCSVLLCCLFSFPLFMLQMPHVTSIHLRFAFHSLTASAFTYTRTSQVRTVI